VQTSNPNLTIKIDDIDFNATNEGVWCLNHHEVTDSNRFTPWQDYGTDLVLTEGQVAPTINPGPTGWTGPLEVKVDDKPTPMPPYMPAPTEPVAPIDIKKLKPVVIETLKDLDVTTDFTGVKNDVTLGLDIAPTTALRPDPETEATVKSLNIIDAASAADAYAEGAKEDPLSKEASKKPVKAKK